MEVCHTRLYLCIILISVLLTVPEIATPPLAGNILPGVTRKSLMELAEKWVSHSSIIHVMLV